MIQIVVVVNGMRRMRRNVRFVPSAVLKVNLLGIAVCAVCVAAGLNIVRRNRFSSEVSPYISGLGVVSESVIEKLR